MPLNTVDADSRSKQQETFTQLWAREKPSFGSGSSTTPWVIEVSPVNGAVFGFVPPGSLAMLVADRESPLLQDIALAASHRDEPLLRKCAHIIAERARAASRSTVDSIAGAVEIAYHGRQIASVVVDRGTGFAFVQLPYHGGAVVPSAFTAKSYSQSGTAMECIVMVREPELSAVEKLVNAMTARPIDGLWFGGVIYNFIKEAAHDVAHAAEDVGHAAVEVAANPGVDEAAEDAGEVAADAAGISAYQEQVSVSATTLSAEPGVDELVEYRNRILSSRN